MSIPTALIEPYRTHRLYSAAFSAIQRTQATEGNFAARILAAKIAMEFEEVALRETSERIRLTMEEQPRYPKYDPNEDCE